MSVIYVSKSGNTKVVAEAIASLFEVEALPLNLIEKKGRGTKEERDREKALFETALEKSRDVDLAFIGTPTYFQQAHSKVTRFTKRVEVANVALFCTYTNKVGETLTGLEEILADRGIGHVGSLGVGDLKSCDLVDAASSRHDEIVNRVTAFVDGYLSRC